jgi:hypothetical protein
MKIVVMLYCLKNNDQTNLYVYGTDTFFKYFPFTVAESQDVEPADKECWLYSLASVI